MHVSFNKILRCPSCIVKLQLKTIEGTGHEIRRGTLLCKSCGSSYPIKNHIPRFVSDDRYASSFSFQSGRYGRTGYFPGGEQILRSVMGLERGDVKGKLILDAGCGVGRFINVFSNWGGMVVGFDLSSAVDVAYSILGSRNAVSLAQADLFQPPFKPESFDLVFSFGVLHHTPNPHSAFRYLSRLVKSGGRLVVYVYTAERLGMRGVFLRLTDFLRALTRRIPHRLLYAAAHLAIVIYGFQRLPSLGRQLADLLPPTYSQHWKQMVLNAFDGLAPRYQSRHSIAEVRLWFELAGFDEIRTSHSGAAVSGIKP